MQVVENIPQLAGKGFGRKMNIPQRSRLRGLHSRWHVRKGIKVATCTYCQEPNVKDISKSTTKSAEVTPQVIPQVKSPQTITAQTADEELRAFKEKMAFRDGAWTCAQAGLSLTEAARTCKLPIQAFVPMVEAEFKENYPSLVETARLDNLRSITLAALRAAKEGDVRLLLRLEEKGLFSNWLEREKDRATSIRGISTPELEQRMREFLNPRQPYSNLAPTISIQDGTPEQDNDSQPQQTVEVSIQNQAEAVKTTRADLQDEEVKSGETRERPPFHAEKPTVHPQGPVIATPAEATPLSIGVRRHVE